MSIVIAALLVASQADVQPAECKGNSTADMNICARWKMDRADARHATYLAKAAAGNAEVQSQIEAADQAFQAYRKAECSALYDSAGGGSIRGILYGQCYLMLTDQRTLAVWSDWLQPMEGGEPLLPKPAPIN